MRFLGRRRRRLHGLRRGPVPKQLGRRRLRKLPERRLLRRRRRRRRLHQLRGRQVRIGRRRHRVRQLRSRHLRRHRRHRLHQLRTRAFTRPPLRAAPSALSAPTQTAPPPPAPAAAPATTRATRARSQLSAPALLGSRPRTPSLSVLGYHRSIMLFSLRFSLTTQGRYDRQIQLSAPTSSSESVWRQLRLPLDQPKTLTHADGSSGPNSQLS